MWRLRLLLGGVGLFGLALAIPLTARAQDPSEALRLDGLYPVGSRSSITDEAWGTLRFGIENRSTTPREARIIVYYPERPDVQYGRDIWVPAWTRLTSWLSIGPPPDMPYELHRDIKYLLYERTNGQLRAISSTEPEKIPSRYASYRAREPTTAVLVDAYAGELDDPDLLAEPNSAAAQAVLFARTFRHARGLSEMVSVVVDRHLPPTPEALDGIDLFVVAGNRLAADPTTQETLRHWVLQGGTLWVMLDQVDPDLLGPILGEGKRFQLVDRTSLASLRLRDMSEDPSQVPSREFDHPVELARVVLSGSETVLFEANGWPAAFTQSLGRGRIIITTLGGRGWYRPRTSRDASSQFKHFPEIPQATDPLLALSGVLYPEPVTGGFRSEDLAPLLAAQIGYEVVGRATAAWVLGGFVLVVIALGVWLRRTRSPELIGVLGPVAAVVTAVAFVVAGGAARRAVPPTAASAAVVEFAPETGEAAARGMFAVYNSESGAVSLGTDIGGTVDLDSSGLDGQTRRRIQTDFDAWHWENLSFPAGVRMGPFRSTPRARASAVGRFESGGLAGRLVSDSFRNPSDPIILSRAGVILAPRLEPDGSFTAGPGDALPPDQFLGGAVLTDLQQRRQALFRQLLARPRPAQFERRDLLLVWADAGDIPFNAAEATRTFSTALLVVPLDFDRSPAGTTITVPSGFIPYMAVSEGRSHRPLMEGSMSTQTRLRFQLPPSVLPLAVEKATLVARVRAPGRRFGVSAVIEGKPALSQSTQNLLGSIRVEIADPRALQVDPAGGLLVEIAMSERIGPDGREMKARASDPEQKWQIESLGLEVTGRVTER